MKTKPVIRVTWLDAVRTDGSTSGLKPAKCVTVGYLVKDATNYIVVAMDKNPADGHRVGLAIPRGMILHAEFL